VTRATSGSETLTVHVPFRIVKRGGRKAIHLPADAPQHRETDNTLIKALARAFRWKRMLDSGEFATLTELAAHERIAPSYMTRVLRLTLLAPDIVEAILDGKQGPAVTLARALEAFRERHPAVEFLSRDGYRSDLISWLISGDLECALLSTTQDLLNMQTRDISTEALVVVGHRSTLADRDHVRGNELAGFQLVLPSRYKSMRNLIDAQFGLQGLVLRPQLEIDSLQSLLHVTLRPGWLSIIPPMALSSELFGGALRSVALVEPVIRRKVVVAWQRHKTLSAPVHGFIDILSEILAGIPGVEIPGRDAEARD